VRVGIVGCGRAGRRRAQALSGARLVSVADAVPERARDLAAANDGCRVAADVAEMVGRHAVEVVIAATPPDALPGVARAAVAAGKHVLMEKPAARTSGELRPLAAEAEAAGVAVRVGFNLRCHPAIAHARALLAGGAIGSLLYLRGRYGHGGRPGYETEWRADRARSGGGQLMDQGVHLVDLTRLFAGEIAEVDGRLLSFFWPAPVEDNAFLFLRSASGVAAWLHASWTEWKNLFSLELFGRNGKLQVDGLGGSYGPSSVTCWRMGPGMGPPAGERTELGETDGSFAAEWAAFAGDIRGGRKTSPGLADAIATLEVVERLYARAGEGAGPAREAAR
jgi:predicted dehydrogenase